MEISIITATLNSIKTLPALVKSLQEQTDNDFEWIIADCKSNDGTLEHLESIKDLKIKISSEKDFGIYDGLNRAIKISTGKYYLVLGSDDILFSESIANFKKFINESSPALIASGLIAGDKKILPRKHLGWLYGMAGVASSHSVGLLIRKNLHDKYGYYSKNLSITADQLFIKQVINAKEIIVRENFISGKMAINGFSSMNILNFQMEFFISQIKTERFKFIQIILLLLRLIKNYNKI